MIVMNYAEHILIIDDDSEIRDLLRQYLINNGFPNVTAVMDGKSAQAILEQQEIALLILDIMLPGEDGFSIAQSIRKDSSIPILMLSARTETADRIHGLQIGADDYLTKPFEPEELLARIHAIFRRTSPLEGELIQSVCFGNVTLKMPERSIVRKGHSDIALTSAEFDLLLLFLTHAGQPLTREEIAEKIGTKLDASSRTIDVRISRLRNRLGDHKAILIQTIRNEGYILSSKVQPLHSH
ncbi:MAG TPA: response regulator transcription factor [Gammaproteobacteria bacterium]|nr:response regulator transcription factor [Gammaproteobacteria bacterium]MBT3489774.1 response regulator transcription factor [Gammaproteobacteria bacterium]MBT4549527.1 response regulator transcription factor [Gammaproteobacteria bacterium]MBT6653529.1 response regulator transcription factor [Gammaproteobacteria bacterium]MBT7327421.1 response regulator transcription factor [Gammaproteobacteria bacterium]